MNQKLELNDEEREAFRKAFDWMEEERQDEGYREAWILARLLSKFAFTILRDMKRAG